MFWKREPLASILLITLLVGAAPTWAQTLAITGATIIDGTGKAPVSDGALLIVDGRIKAVGRSSDVAIPKGAKRLDARGKYVMPGMMDANVHIGLSHTLNVEVLFKYEDRFDEIIVEGAQLALKSGLTTVFDTWGPFDALIKARARINSGEAPGSRLYIAGTVIGSDGPFRGGFLPRAALDMASKSTIERFERKYEQGVGRRLLRMTPEQVRAAIHEYGQKPVDFFKYAGNHDAGDMIAFSPRVQRIIVEEGHRAGKTVQVHVMSVEGLDLAIEAGVDIVTHGEVSLPPTPIPDETIRKLVERKIPISVLPATQRRLDALAGAHKYMADLGSLAKSNRRRMIKAGVTMALSTDAYPQNPEWLPESTPPEADAVDPDRKVGEAHFNALVALEEEGMDRMEILKTATSNVARAYKVDANLGTLEPGKIADVVILDANPLDSARNYRRINAVIKEGKVVNRDALPLAPIITAKAGSNSR